MPQVIRGDAPDNPVYSILVNDVVLVDEENDDIYFAAYPTLAAGPSGTLAAIWQAQPVQSTEERLYIAEYRPDGSGVETTTKRYAAGGRPLALTVIERYTIGSQPLTPQTADYYSLFDPTGTSLTLVDETGEEAAYILYNAYGGVLTSSLSTEAAAVLAERGSLPDPDTGLVHLGNGRWYNPELGRPLQPNPAGGSPTVAQALNRYAATPLGQPGVAQAIQSGGNIFANPIAWTGLAANAGLEISSRRVLAESGQLVLEGSLSAIGKSLGLSQGKFTLGNLEIDRIVLGGVPVARATLRNAGKVTYLGEGQFSLGRSGQVIDVNGIKKVTFRQGLWLSEARALRTVTSVGLTAVLDVGFELYEFGTNTGQWGNPYLTTGQKTGQAFLVIGSDLALAGTLAFYGVAWKVAIPVTLVWAFITDPVFAHLPGTSQFYGENRNLQPLE